MKKQPKRERETHETFVPIEDKLAPTPQGWPHHEGCEPYGRREPTGTCKTRASWRAKDRQEGHETLRPNKLWTHNHRDSQSVYIRHIARQQLSPGEDSPLAKLSDKPGNSAATSHKECRQTEGGRRNTTSRPQKGWLNQKGTTTNVNLRSRSRVTKRHYWPKGWPHPEGIHRRRKLLKPTHTRSREEEPSANAQGQPEKEGQPPGLTHAEEHSVSHR